MFVDNNVKKLKYNYPYNEALPERAWNYTKFAWHTDIGNREGQPNIMEKIGNGLLWATDQFAEAVKYVALSFQNPSVITVAITAIALVALSFAFYPATAVLAVVTAWHFTVLLASVIPAWAVKFTAYISCCAWILGHGLRALGRFTNDELMQEFYDFKQKQDGLNQKTHEELVNFHQTDLKRRRQSN